jgi:hypothetical protein
VRLWNPVMLPKSREVRALGTDLTIISVLEGRGAQEMGSLHVPRLPRNSADMRVHGARSLDRQFFLSFPCWLAPN